MLDFLQPLLQGASPFQAGAQLVQDTLQVLGLHAMFSGQVMLHTQLTFEALQPLRTQIET